MNQKEIEVGAFFAAHPNNTDPLLSKTIVMIYQHNSLGTRGIIVTKPLNSEIGLLLMNDIGICSTKSSQFYAGGTQSVSTLYLLHTNKEYKGEQITLEKSLFLASSATGIPAIVSEKYKSTMYFGHVFWPLHKFENEITKRYWIKTKVKQCLLFSSSMQSQWIHSIRELGGTYSSFVDVDFDVYKN